MKFFLLKRNKMYVLCVRNEMLRKGLIDTWCTQEGGCQFPKLMSQPAAATAFDKNMKQTIITAVRRNWILISNSAILKIVLNLVEFGRRGLILRWS